MQLAPWRPSCDVSMKVSCTSIKVLRLTPPPPPPPPPPPRLEDAPLGFDLHDPASRPCWRLPEGSPPCRNHCTAQHSSLGRIGSVVKQLIDPTTMLTSLELAFFLFFSFLSFFFKICFPRPHSRFPSGWVEASRNFPSRLHREQNSFHESVQSKLFKELSVPVLWRWKSLRRSVLHRQSAVFKTKTKRIYIHC